jgi:hypothetical protein
MIPNKKWDNIALCLPVPKGMTGFAAVTQAHDLDTAVLALSPSPASPLLRLPESP